eukprot:CAMPEP_0170471990 /NCGR_PEP_ID=MMETSP0123-20130129/14100_1 /TAXON_ID=182087 /ORGANISM="Favella ehrenbergii, Strain Fehren 1" /LENGTH=84 /DNA_ID=CAMNT_0010739971 /DNA_START=459 /DNA_END=710 /DNA_ORIENTATION=-
MQFEKEDHNIAPETEDDAHDLTIDDLLLLLGAYFLGIIEDSIEKEADVKYDPYVQADRKDDYPLAAVLFLRAVPIITANLLPVV